MAKAIGCFTSGSAAKTFALKPGGSVISFTAWSGESPAFFTTSRGGPLSPATFTAANCGFVSKRRKSSKFTCPQPSLTSSTSRMKISRPLTAARSTTTGSIVSES